MDDSPPNLPPLQQSLLDEETLAALFVDLRQCASIIEVIIKQGPRDMALEARPSLDEAETLLRQGKVRGVQVRYRFEQAEWCDTLIATPSGVRLTRIRQGVE
jgi:hypothetical protein